MKNISTGTIIRTITTLLVLINIVLQSIGKSPIPLEDDVVTNLISAIAQVVVILAAWWKNNSFTSAAITADDTMKRIKSGHGTE